MTFEDLPRDALTLPMTDPQVRADMIDLIVGDRDRILGCVGLWLCDEDLVAQQPVIVADLGKATPAKVRRIMEVMLKESIGPVFVGIGRVGSPLFTQADRDAALTITQVCREQGVRCLGVYVATPSGVRELPKHLRLAS